MSYDEFVRQMEAAVKKRIKKGHHVVVHATLKNNGYERKGISFIEDGNPVSPTIYLEEYFEKFNQGEEIEAIAKEMIDLYERIHVDKTNICEDLRSFEHVKHRIFYKFINKRKNEKLLAQLPYVEYLDLAMVFLVLVEEKDNQHRIATMTIRKEHLDLWMVTEEEIYQYAYQNTERLFPFEFRTMEETLDEMVEVSGVSAEIDESLLKDNMYVLSNKSRNFGSNVMCYEGMLEYIGSELRENYYLLPSSIHELIVVAESGALPVEEMRCIVKEINETYVHEEEILSDCIYYYDRMQKEIKML